MLSEADQCFWKYLNNNVHRTINPFTGDFNDWHPSALNNHTDILWIGRLSAEKRPFAGLNILEKVLTQIPEAHLHIVGSGNEEITKNLEKKIHSMNLEDHVTMHGFQADVQQYYYNAAVMLITSEYEGYLLTLLESKQAGLPCVAYDMPYLALFDGNRGMSVVPQNDTASAANTIVDLLKSPEKQKMYGQQARMHAEELYQYDFKSKWRKIFTSVNVLHEDMLSKAEHVMMETLIQHHVKGIKKLQNYSNTSSVQKQPIPAKGCEQFFRPIAHALPKPFKSTIKKALLLIPHKQKVAIKKAIGG